MSNCAAAARKDRRAPDLVVPPETGSAAHCPHIAPRFLPWSGGPDRLRKGL